jgi:CO/xanthine dehydrogenase FAD-binding subunit
MVSPASLDEALAFLAERADEDWTPFAGGTDVMVGLEFGTETRTRWLDLSRLGGELGRIEGDGAGVRVGGMATMTALRRSELLARTCPLIAQAAATVGAAQIQNRATVAGNLVNASPAGDTLPVWLVLDAEVELTSAAGVRRVPYRDFTPAYRTTVRRPDELVTAVLYAPPPGAHSTHILFRKIGTRAAQAISKVVFAGMAHVDPAGTLVDVRLAFGSMAPTPVRAAAAEAAATSRPFGPETGRAAAARLAEDLAPIDDVRSTAAYRRRVSENLVREFLAGNLGHEFAP